jgi:hypothetical protein
MLTFYSPLLAGLPSEPHRRFARTFARLDAIFDLFAEVQQMRRDAHSRYPFMDD